MLCEVGGYNIHHGCTMPRGQAMVLEMFYVVCVFYLLFGAGGMFQ